MAKALPVPSPCWSRHSRCLARAPPPRSRQEHGVEPRLLLHPLWSSFDDRCISLRGSGKVSSVATVTMRCPPRCAEGVTTPAIKARLDVLSRDFDRLAEAAESAARQ